MILGLFFKTKLTLYGNFEFFGYLLWVLNRDENVFLFWCNNDFVFLRLQP